MSAYYNEIDPFCCEVLRDNAARGRLPKGFVDERDVTTIGADELMGYRQWHLFAGIGGIPYGLKLAGMPDDFPILTGGFPCQDVSVAGAGAGLAGERSGLWWEMFRLISELRPRYVVIENVPALRTRGADEVLASLEGEGYRLFSPAELWPELAIYPEAHVPGPLVVGADDLGAPHRRKRVWIVAHTHRDRKQQSCRYLGEERRRAENGGDEFVADTDQKPVRAAARSLRPAPGEVEADSQQWERSGLAARDGGAAMGDADRSRLAQCECQRRGDAQEQSPAVGAGWLWPAGPADPQYEWEYARACLPATLLNLWTGMRTRYPQALRTPEQKRAAEKNFDLTLGSLDGAVDGLSARLVRRHQVASLSALGNAVVPGLVMVIGRALLAFDRRPG